MGRKQRFDMRKNAEKKRQEAAGTNIIGRPKKHLRVACQDDDSLPTDWVKCNSTDDTVTTYAKVIQSESKGSVITHTVTIKSDGSWILHILGEKLNANNYTVLKPYLPTILNSNANSILTTLNTLRFCSGHTDTRFANMLKSQKIRGVAFLDDRCDVHVEGCSYSVTVRHINCCLLIPNGTKCHACKAYRSTLRALYSRSVKQKSRLSSSPRSHVNIRFLKTPEIQKRFTAIKARAKAASRKLSNLKSKIDDEMTSKGVQLDESFDKDMSTIMDESNEFVEKNYPANSFERLFWEEQRKARQLKCSKQMRWHPMFIRWCLRIKFISTAAYTAVRSSGLLRLPSERTLRDYTNWMKAKPGFQPEVDKQLMEEAELTTIQDYQKYVCVVFDEVKVKEGLVYDKEGCNLIGFVDLDNTNNHLRDFASSLSDSKPTLATHIVVFMVRGLFSSLKFPYVQFPCSSLTASTLYALVWECVSHLETIGFKVLALTADGASCNRKFFKMHKCQPKVFPHKSVNICSDEERPIFFFSDPPHLMKTVRNCWSNSFGHSYARKLWNNGQYISWQTLVTLYEHHRLSGSGLTVIPRITAEHIHLNSYSKMKVKYAVQVLSKSVGEAIGLELDKKPYLYETQKFVLHFNKFFDCMNVRCLKECIYERKPDVRPYNSKSDPRLEWLKKYFLTWLDNWDTSVRSRVDLSPSEQDRCCISRETLEGLRFTVTSFCEMMDYIFTNIPDVKYFLSEKICQDPLESFFGHQRIRGGSSDNPNVASFVQGTVSIRSQRSVLLQPLRGNCTALDNPKLIVDETPLKKRQRRK